MMSSVRFAVVVLTGVPAPARLWPYKSTSFVAPFLSPV